MIRGHFFLKNISLRKMIVVSESLLFSKVIWYPEKVPERVDTSMLRMNE